MADGIYLKQRLNLDIIGLASRISEAVINIDAGRKGFATKGKAEEGRISYETGIAEAMAAFKEAQKTANPETIILAEYTFLSQELEFCHESDKYSKNSLIKALQRFDDAFLALQAVEEPEYKIVENVFPHDKDYRFKGFPLDAFHVACGSHRARLQNILRAPGIDPIEKELLIQRLDNLPTAQEGYVEKQKKALATLANVPRDIAKTQKGDNCINTHE